MLQVLQMILKVFLLLMGSVMLLGGGICAVSDVYFAVSNGLHSDGAFLLLLALVSALIAWAGWWAVSFSWRSMSRRSSEDDEPEMKE